MSDHLDLDKCKRLAELGMSQEIKSGDWFWYKPRVSDEWISTMFYTVPLPDDMKYYLIPSLKTIMEFAKTLTGRWVWYPTDDGWECDLFQDSVDNELFPDADPVLAVYALIDKVGKV